MSAVTPVMTRSAETHPLTWRIDQLNGQLLDLKTYETLEGFSALRRAIKELSPQDVQQIVKDANLRGRGGAGFPAGIKWSLVPMGDAAPKQKYLVCNADEMEPGTFKDRLLMEQLPHQLVESMILAGYALQVSKAYIFLRGEYVVAAERLNRAIAKPKLPVISVTIFSAQVGAWNCLCTPVQAVTSAVKKPR